METSLAGLWVLQALCGVETLPAALRCHPYIPSVHAAAMVGGDTAPVTLSPEYTELRSAGIIRDDGTVDDIVAAWMQVIGRPDRSVLLSMRRPGYGTVIEKVMVVCRRGPYLTKIVRSDDRILIGSVGQADDPTTQDGLFATEVLAAVGDYEPADIIVNLPTGFADATLATRWDAAALRHLGATAAEADILAEAADPNESALAAVAVIDHGETDRVHRRVLTIADTRHGRLMLTATFGVGGQEWLSAQPGTTSGIRAELVRLLQAA